MYEDFVGFLDCHQDNFTNTSGEVEPKMTNEIIGNLVSSILEKLDLPFQSVIWHNYLLLDKQLPPSPLEALKRCNQDCFSGINILLKILITLRATGATTERDISS